MEKDVAKRAVRIEPEDNVAVVVQDVLNGDAVDCSGSEILSRGDISRGHKIACRFISEGEKIVKYAVTIGIASREIYPGEHVHSHNVRDITNQLCNEYAQQFRAAKV